MRREFAYPLLTAVGLCVLGKIATDGFEIDFAEAMIGAMMFWHAQQWWRE